MLSTDRELPPYALIIAEVVDRQGGDVLVRLSDPSGRPTEVWIDDSSAAPLSKDDATEVAEQWRIGLPS